MINFPTFTTMFHWPVGWLSCELRSACTAGRSCGISLCHWLPAASPFD